MNRTYDTEQRSKRLPYTTPDGFFDTLEANVWSAVKDDYLTAASPAGKSFRRSIIVRWAVTAAASVALFFIADMGYRQQHACGIDEVNQAFSRLSSDDQAYLLSVYQDDVFINE